MSRFRGSCFILMYAVACVLIAATTFTAPAQAPIGNAMSATSMTPAASEEANKGIDALRNAHFDEAIAHFQQAVELDPDSTLAKFYLGSALARNVVPMLDTPDNLKTAHQAIDILQQVLEKSPHNTTVMKQIAAVYIEI
jgi:tetratricopeptide (TPR) repeat protein